MKKVAESRSFPINISQSNQNSFVESNSPRSPTSPHSSSSQPSSPHSPKGNSNSPKNSPKKHSQHVSQTVSNAFNSTVQGNGSHTKSTNGIEPSSPPKIEKRRSSSSFIMCKLSNSLPFLHKEASNEELPVGVLSNKLTEEHVKQRIEKEQERRNILDHEFAKEAIEKREKIENAARKKALQEHVSLEIDHGLDELLKTYVLDSQQPQDLNSIASYLSNFFEKNQEMNKKELLIGVTLVRFHLANPMRFHQLQQIDKLLFHCIKYSGLTGIVFSYMEYFPERIPSFINTLNVLYPKRSDWAKLVDFVEAFEGQKRETYSLENHTIATGLVVNYFEKECAYDLNVIFNESTFINEYRTLIKIFYGQFKFTEDSLEVLKILDEIISENYKYYDKNKYIEELLFIHVIIPFLILKDQWILAEIFRKLVEKDRFANELSHYNGLLGLLEDSHRFFCQKII